MCSSDLILQAQKWLASKEGIFAEPASAASLAGVIKQHKQGLLEKGARVVCVLTGNGLKDPNAALSQIVNPQKIRAEKQAVLDVIYGK